MFVRADNDTALELDDACAPNVMNMKSLCLISAVAGSQPLGRRHQLHRRPDMQSGSKKKKKKSK